MYFKLKKSELFVPETSLSSRRLGIIIFPALISQMIPPLSSPPFRRLSLLEENSFVQDRSFDQDLINISLSAMLRYHSYLVFTLIGLNNSQRYKTIMIWSMTTEDRRDGSLETRWPHYPIYCRLGLSDLIRKINQHLDQQRWFIMSSYDFHTSDRQTELRTAETLSQNWLEHKRSFYFCQNWASLSVDKFTKDRGDGGHLQEL